MKANGDVAQYGDKHDKQHGQAKRHKHGKQDKPQKHEARAFEPLQQNQSDLPREMNPALASGRSGDRFFPMGSPVPDRAMRPAMLLDDGAASLRIAPTWRRDPINHLLIPSNPCPDSGRASRSLSARRSTGERLEFWTHLDQETWQIDIEWPAQASVSPGPAQRGVTVRNWHTQKQLASGQVNPRGPDGAVACLERLRKRNRMPHALVMDHQPGLFAVVEQWAFAHGVMVVICHPSLSSVRRRFSLY